MIETNVASIGELRVIKQDAAKLKAGEETGYYMLVGIRLEYETTHNNLCASIKRQEYANTEPYYEIFISEDGILENNHEKLLTAKNPEEIEEILESLIQYTLAFLWRYRRALQLWHELADVPVVMTEDGKNVTDAGWHCVVYGNTTREYFPKGTNVEDIWHWFEDTFQVSVAKLMGQ